MKLDQNNDNCNLQDSMHLHLKCTAISMVTNEVINLHDNRFHDSVSTCKQI